MAESVYECMFILDSNRYARDPNKIATQIPQLVTKNDGEVLASRLWNEQKLAYPVNGHRKGTYWLTYFRMSNEKVADFNRSCQLNDSVLRNLTLKVDPRLVDALVAHAKGESIAPPSEVTEEGEPTEVAKPAEVTSDSEAVDDES